MRSDLITPLSRRSQRLPANAIAVALFLLLARPDSNAVPHATPPSEVDGSGAFATGHYRNLFAEAGHSPTEISRKIDTAFAQLFHGDPQTQAVVFAAGKNANHDVRTEGMSYGMMITVQLDKKAEFDALWNWAKTYMYISDPNHPSYGYFSWSCKTDGTPNEETAASDGEECFVISLYFAAHLWGNGTGIYNYKMQADELLTTVRHRTKKAALQNSGCALWPMR
jgi:oligosaccharide reducing-end xylanase